jgi:anaerobic magnesium-protoporphyrin IX monomethyl ester cyclase
MNEIKEFSIVLISLFNIDFGIRFISSFLKAKGCPAYIILFNQIRYRTEFLDNDYFTGRLLKHPICPEKDLRLLLKLLDQLQPQLIGISVTSVTMRTAQRITAEIKKHFDIPVVWGGIHPIIAPEECIQHADIVCIGEGEIPMWELAERLKTKQPLSGIKNLWIKNNGSLEKNELRPLITDLDTLPFPDFIAQGNKFLIDSGRITEDPPIISAYDKNIYPIMTSRGCMFSCAFCCNSVIREKYENQGPYLRRRSVNNVIQELKLVIQNKPIYSIQFWDDVFTYDKTWIKEFCDRYLREIGRPFVCYANPKYTDREILQKLADTGLYSIWLGIQSGSESINRNIFSRSHSNKEVIDFALIMKALHIKARYDLISDNPYETEFDQDKTVILLLELPHPYPIIIYSLCYFPKTQLTLRALRDGLITPQDLEQYTSKALNNFFMYLPLSKDKKQLFWNCIKAMAVNRHFPKELVRFCKRNNFFKKYPYVLFSLGYIYLNLFKHLGKEKFLISFDSVVVLKNPQLNIIFGKSNLLFIKQNLSFLLFPLENFDKCKKFCLKIINQFKRDLYIKLFVEVYSANSRKINRNSLWEKVKLKIKSHSQTEVYFQLIGPELYFSFGEERKKLLLLKVGDFVTAADELYNFEVKYYFVGQYTSLRYGSVKMAARCIFNR